MIIIRIKYQVHLHRFKGASILHRNAAAPLPIYWSSIYHSSLLRTASQVKMNASARCSSWCRDGNMSIAAYHNTDAVEYEWILTDEKVYISEKTIKKYHSAWFNFPLFCILTSLQHFVGQQTGYLHTCHYRNQDSKYLKIWQILTDNRRQNYKKRNYENFMRSYSYGFSSFHLSKFPS